MAEVLSTGGIMKKGFFLRFGVSVKETGERMAHVRLFGIPVLRSLCGPVIELGKIITTLSARLYKAGDLV